MLGNYRVSYESAELFIKDQGTFVANLLEDLRTNSHEQYKMMVHSTALLFAEGVNGLSSIMAQRNEGNQPTDSLPPALPQHLLKLRPYEFSQIVEMQHTRLKELFTEDQFICIYDEFKLWRDAYRQEDEFKRFVDNFDHKTTFTEA